MYKSILAIQYYEKDKRGKMLGHRGYSQCLSKFTKEVFQSINKFLIKYIDQSDIKDRNKIVVSEIILQTNNLNSRNLGQNVYLQIEDLLSIKKIDLLNAELIFNFESEIKNQDILKLLEVLKQSIEKDLNDFYKEKIKKRR